jgi:hypothetical protein
MLKNLFADLFRLIAATVLMINLILLSPFSQPGLAVPLSIATSPEQAPVTSTNPQPSGTPKTQGAQKSAESQTQRNAAQKASQNSTSDKEQSKPAAPYDMEAVKAFNRALYGS